MLYQYKNVIKKSAAVYNGDLAIELDNSVKYDVMSPINLGTNYTLYTGKYVIQDTLSNQEDSL